MGTRAVAACIDAGKRVVVFDSVEGPRKRARELGARIAEHPVEVMQQSKVVLLFLPGPAQVRSCVSGSRGLLEAGAPGKTIIDMSTVDPAVSVEMSTAASAADTDYLDAPVLGRPDSVGDWALPVGGNPDVLEQVRPMLEILASKIYSTGPAGAGNRVKLLNQLMFGAINAVTAEMMAIASKLDISQRVLYETITQSEAGTVSNLFKELGRRVVEDHYTEPTFTVDLLVKDVRLASEMAMQAGAPPLLTRSVEFMNEAAQAAGLGGLDTSVMWKSVEGYWREPPDAE